MQRPYYFNKNKKIACPKVKKRLFFIYHFRLIVPPMSSSAPSSMLLALSRFTIGLPFAQDSLEPHISAQTIDFHYNKHHKGYDTNLQALMIKDTSYNDLSLEDIIRTSYKKNDMPIYNNAAQIWNHNFYWQSICPPGSCQTVNQGAFFKAVEDKGGFDALADALIREGLTQFGSGWVWLVLTPEGKLEIKKTSNADPIWLHSDDHPLLIVDVWEHAYYLDYQNRRKDHLDHVKSLLNWTFAADRFAMPHFAMPQD